jgi:RecB family endonuclease NucS
VLPEALRLIIVKADGSVLVHADAGGYKPLTTSRGGASPPTSSHGCDCKTGHRGRG